LRKLKLTDEIRNLLKKPLGTLIEGTQDETIEELRKIVETEKPKIIVAVGDAVSQNMVNHGINANIYIIDYKTMRTPIEYHKLNVAISTQVKNPAGEITEEAWNNIKELVHQTKTAEIIVDGEEDLLTLPAIAQAPIDSLIIYGQPEVGIVVVKVTDKKKKEIKEIVYKMQVLNRRKKASSGKS
jgi:uncharacterized protein (UPF0218 family)